MGGLDVFVVGDGKSAGQAAAHLAGAGAQVTVLVRGASLTASMSDYLVRELDASPRTTVRFGTEVVGAGTARRLDNLILRDRTDGTTTTVAADALSVFVGARPHTDWLHGVLVADDNGFLITGRDLADQQPESWPLKRAAAWLEASLPGVFAAGDIRRESVKHVAAAVGEGSTAAMLVQLAKPR
jgi:thioredoxin reductase (NADPH)